MSAHQIVLLAVAALAVFWMVGAYNRLVALRKALGGAWLQVAVLRVPMAPEQGALDALVAAQAQLGSAAQQLGQRPTSAAQAAAVQAAEATLGPAAARVLALLEQQSDLRHSPAAAVPLAQLREGGSRLAFARQLFNDASAAYNAAIAQRPTRWLARLYGFDAAGRL